MKLLIPTACIKFYQFSGCFQTAPTSFQGGGHGVHTYKTYYTGQCEI